MGPPVTYEEIGQLFDEAEEKVKLAEQTLFELVIPAVNELRYAGRHLVNACRSEETGDSERADRERRKAAKHCKRAIYDAQEARAIFYFQSFELFRADYRRNVIGDVVSRYLEIKTAIGGAHTRFTSISAEKRDDRDGFVAEVDSICEEIEPLVRLLEESREEMNKKETERILTEAAIAGNQKNQKISLRLTFAGLAIATLAYLAGLFS